MPVITLSLRISAKYLRSLQLHNKFRGITLSRTIARRGDERSRVSRHPLILPAARAGSARRDAAASARIASEGARRSRNVVDWPSSRGSRRSSPAAEHPSETPFFTHDERTRNNDEESDSGRFSRRETLATRILWTLRWRMICDLQAARKIHTCWHLLLGGLIGLISRTGDW